MKKTFSIFLSLLLAISCLSVGSINAFANTKKTAQEIYLNSSAAVWGDLGNKAYVEFTPSYTGSFEFYCFNQSYGGNIMASIEDFSGETYNTVLNDNNPNLICAATLEAGKTYYYVLESASVSFSNVVSVRNHNHDFSLYNSYPAHYDQYDSAQNYDGYVESICAYCPEYIRTASFPAVSSVKAKTKSFTYNKKKKTTSVKVYDRMGLDNEYMKILGVEVTTLTIPVKPGRNLAVIIEVAAMNNRQKKMGYNAARELLKNLGMAVEDLPPSPKVIVDTWE